MNTEYTLCHLLRLTKLSDGAGALARCDVGDIFEQHVLYSIRFMSIALQTRTQSIECGNSAAVLDWHKFKQRSALALSIKEVVYAWHQSIIQICGAPCAST